MDDTFTLSEDQEYTDENLADVSENDSDMEGDEMTFTLISGPSDAANFVLNDDGTFEYCPVSDWDGTDSFVYEVTDGIDSSQATVTISSMSDVSTSISKKDGSPGSGEGSAGAPAGGYQELGNDDVVTVWDNNDGTRTAGIADSDDFSNAADFGTQIGTHSWADLVSQLTTYAQNNGLINELYIFDHGYTEGGGQQFGDDVVTAAMWADLAPLLSSNCTITLAGCYVGSNAAYCDAVADATGATVSATADTVTYGTRWFARDFWATNGTWLTFHGTDD